MTENDSYMSTLLYREHKKDSESEIEKRYRLLTLTLLVSE